MNEEKIGKFICELRKENNLTQNELAKKLNVTNKAVSKWETGKGFPDITLLIPISELFNISVNELLVGKRLKNKNDTEEQTIKNTIKFSEIQINLNKIKLKRTFKIILLILFILLYITSSLSTLNILLVTILWLLTLTLKIIHTKSKKNLILLTLTLVFSFYSFFTCNGSVRLELFLMGHPIKAYTTPLEENTGRKIDNKRYFTPIKDIQVTSGTMGYIECKNYFGIKLSSYYGY